MAGELRKSCEKSIAAQCASIGFKKKKHFFLKPLNENVSATLGFGLTSQANNIAYINPVVGVFYADMYKLYVQLNMYGDRSVPHPVTSMSLGYLMSANTYIEWPYTEENKEEVMEEIFNAVEKYGPKLYGNLKEPDNLYQALQNITFGVLNHNRRYYLPILYYLKGDKLGGMQFIEEEITGLSTPMSAEKRARLKTLGEVVIVSGYDGKVPPEYLEFKERFSKLP